MCKLESGKILVQGLRLHAYHGVLPQERIVGNDYLIDLSAEYDISKAAETDDIADAISYAAVCDVIVEEMRKPSRLLETVAMRIAKRLVKEYDGVSSVTIRIMKENPPMGYDCKSAGVEACLTNDKTL